MSVFFFVLLYLSLAHGASEKPHIVVIVADDLGYHDVGYHGAEYETKAIDALAARGIALETHYSQSQCTPSRAAFMTGRYASNAGLPFPALGGNPFGLEPNHTTLPEELQGRGYTTAMVGKWHLGHAKWSYTPTHRGFDFFTGSLLGACGYVSKVLPPAADLRRQEEAIFTDEHYTSFVGSEASNVIRQYASGGALGQMDRAVPDDSPLFLYVAFTAPHTPIEADKESLARCAQITHPFRREYCGLVVGMDDAIAAIVQALEDTRMWERTLVVFFSDNGGFGLAGGSNAPFRGQKSGMWEGAIRTAALLSGGHLATTLAGAAGSSRLGEAYHGTVHVADWYNTLLSFVDVAEFGEVSEDRVRALPSGEFGVDVDSLSLYDSIIHNTSSVREETLLAYDDYQHAYAYREGGWKLMVGRPGDHRVFRAPLTVDDSVIHPADATWIDRSVETLYRYVWEALAEKQIFLADMLRELSTFLNDWWLWTDFASIIRVPLGDDDPPVFLFDLANDPTEEENLAHKPEHQDRLQRMRQRLLEMQQHTPRQKHGNIMDPERTLRAENPSRPDVLYHGPWLSESDDPWVVAETRGIDFLMTTLRKTIIRGVGGVLVAAFVAERLLIRPFLRR